MSRSSGMHPALKDGSLIAKLNAGKVCTNDEIYNKISMHQHSKYHKESHWLTTLSTGPVCARIHSLALVRARRSSPHPEKSSGSSYSCLSLCVCVRACV